MNASELRSRSETMLPSSRPATRPGPMRRHWLAREKRARRACTNDRDVCAPQWTFFATRKSFSWRILAVLRMRAATSHSDAHKKCGEALASTRRSTKAVDFSYLPGWGHYVIKQAWGRSWLHPLAPSAAPEAAGLQSGLRTTQFMLFPSSLRHRIIGVRSSGVAPAALRLSALPTQRNYSQ